MKSTEGRRNDYFVHGVHKSIPIWFFFSFRSIINNINTILLLLFYFPDRWYNNETERPVNRFLSDNFFLYSKNFNTRVFILDV